MEFLDYMIRVRGGQASKREAEKAAAGMDRYGNALTDADKAAGRFIDTQGRMREVNGQFVKGMTETVKSGRRLSNVMAMVSARLISMGATTGVLVVALGLLAPALIAIGASAGAAVLGGGIVGGAGLLGLITSLAGVGIIAGSLIGQLEKVKAAQDQLNLTIAQYGANSEEATDAWIKFNAVVAENGGAPTLKFLERINALTESWEAKTTSARDALRDIAGMGLGLAEKLLPAFATETNRGAGALRGAVSNTTRQLGGKEVQDHIAAFGQTGSRLIPQIAAGLTDLVFAVLRLLRPALPYIEQAAEIFRDWAHGVRDAAGDGDKLVGFVGMLVEHTKQWLELGGALIETLKILFGGSQESGKGLAESMTATVDSFNEWLQATKDSGDLKRFFQDIAQLAKLVGWLIAVIVVSSVVSMNMTKAAFDAIVVAGTAAVEWIKTAWDDTIGFLSDLPGRIADATVGMWDGIKNGFRDAINWVIEKWNSLEFGMDAKKVGGHTVIPGFHVGTPDIPLLAEGGNIRTRGSVVVGDEGPEVLDLPAGATVTPLTGPNAPQGRIPDVVAKINGRELMRILGADIEAQMARGG